MDVQDDPTVKQTEQESPDSTPPLPPSPDDSSDSKISRKREREVSLEPATPVATSIEVEGERSEHKDRRTPAKKNRVSAQLDATQEEDEDFALSSSPPHETKIRQISQGVEDLTWQTMQKDHTLENDQQMELPHVEGQEQEDMVETKFAGEEEMAVVPVLLQGENPSLMTDGAGDDEHTGQTDPAEVPPDAKPSHSQELDKHDIQLEISSTSASQPVPILEPHSRRGSESDEEKRLKRKLGDRTVSERHVPGETPLQSNGIISGSGAAKRQRDDPDTDANPRVTKRPTPPPDEEREAELKNSIVPSRRSKSPEKSTPISSTATSKLGGFMAYASSSSPFASVSGPNVFESKTSSPSSSTWASTSTSPNPSPNLTASPFSSAVSTASPSKSPEVLLVNQAHKRTGFEAFASVSSPFASAAKRPKSPPPPFFGTLARSNSPSRHTPVRGTNAFSAYAVGGAQSFAARTPKRATPVFGEGSGSGTEGANKASVGLGILDTCGKQEDDSGEDDGRRVENENGSVTFGERLRSQRDDNEEGDEEPRVALTEQEILTGEEDEETIYQVRGKLFALSSQNQWKERGTGLLRLNVRREDGTGARLVMRKEAVYTVLLNATLFKGMRCFPAQDPRYLRFSVFEGGITTHYNLRVQSAKIAEELLEEINSHIPSE